MRIYTIWDGFGRKRYRIENKKQRRKRQARNKARKKEIRAKLKQLLNEETRYAN